jgi:signal transduction histidine kinase
MTLSFARPRDDEAALRRPTVLVVEDDEATRSSLSRTLTGARLNVVTAATGAAGVAAAREVKPDIVLLDIGLPDMSGFEACAVLKRDAGTASVPVMFLSAAYVSAFDKVRGLEGGGDIFLSHPIEPTVLVATVRALLRVRRADAEREQALAREREARQVAEEAQDRLAAALHGREDALANVVHDLRSPLQTIDLAAQYLNQKLDPSMACDGARRQAAAIQRAAAQMSSLVSNLLDHAKLRAGQVVLHLGDVDAAALIDDSFEAHRLLAEEKRLVLEVARPIGALRALADVTRVQRVLANLLSNAMKFTPAGGRVELGARGEGANVMFWVRDTGSGIPPEQLPRVFERFWQARDRPASEGAGLGLAIAKGIIEAHGGRISIESRLGEGTQVSFTVPRSP